MIKKKFVLVFTIFYITFSLFILFFANYIKFDNIIESCKRQEKDVLERVIKSLYNADDEKFEDMNYLNNLLKSETYFIFLYKENIVLYEKNLQNSKKYKGATIRELYNDYTKNSGVDIVDDMLEMLESEEGIEYMTKMPSIGDEIIAWKNIEIDGYRYTVGVECPIRDILLETKYYLFRNISFFTNICSDILILIFCFSYYKRATKE